MGEILAREVVVHQVEDPVGKVGRHRDDEELDFRRNAKGACHWRIDEEWLAEVKELSRDRLVPRLW